MALNINTNIGALGAAAAASSVNKSMEISMERLSTGLRINSAADDAAGVAMSSRMDAQIRGLNQAIRNAGDAQSLIDTTEGSHDEITNILQRMRELAVQSANDTNVASDRAALQAEITQLVSEIDRIAGQTTWNGMSLLDGTFSDKAFQIGAEQGQTVSISVDSVATAQIGNYTANSFAQLSSTANGGIVATDYTIVGHLGSETITTTAGDSAKEFAAAVNLQSSATGVSATAVTKLKLSALSAAEDITLTINGTAISTVAVASTSDLRDVMSAINAKSGTTGVTATLYGGSNAALELTDIDGDDIKIALDATTATTEFTLTVLDKNGATATENDGATALSVQLIDTAAAAGDAATVTVTGQVSLNSIKSFNVTTDHDGTAASSTAADTVVADGEFFGASGTDQDVVTNATLSNIAAVDISTHVGAGNAIKAIDGAIDKINAARAGLGAVSNRLDSTIANLTSIQTNVESSRGRIQDADFAAESTNLAKTQILQQASMAMLAQANASKQGVLQLLQG